VKTLLQLPHIHGKIMIIIKFDESQECRIVLEALKTLV